MEGVFQFFAFCAFILIVIGMYKMIRTERTAWKPDDESGQPEKQERQKYAFTADETETEFQRFLSASVKDKAEKESEDKAAEEAKRRQEEERINRETKNDAQRLAALAIENLRKAAAEADYTEENGKRIIKSAASLKVSDKYADIREIQTLYQESRFSRKLYEYTESFRMAMFDLEFQHFMKLNGISYELFMSAHWKKGSREESNRIPFQRKMSYWGPYSSLNDMPAEIYIDAECICIVSTNENTPDGE